MGAQDVSFFPRRCYNLLHRHPLFPCKPDITGPFKMKIICSLLVFLLSTVLYADGVTGFWQTMDKKNHRPTSVIAVYPYEGKYYGRIVAIYDDKGSIQETIYNPKKRAPNLVGDP